MSHNFGTETIRLSEEDAGWLRSYEWALRQTSLSATSRQVVVADSRYIADRAALPVDDPHWGSSRVRTGVVMGAVQSGKTASMIGVLARALDNGVNVAVVLAGTRTALWLQTLERIRAQLDSAPKPIRRRLFLPNPRVMAASGSGDLRTLYRVNQGTVANSFRRQRPIIVVAMKQVDHLQQLSHALHDTLFPTARDQGVPVRLLVIDDEADDSSITDDRFPWGSAHLESFKQVPRRILDLWEDRSSPGQTVADHVYATYMAYTATPQANFLQDAQNPLAPRDFVASLRTPGPEGTVEHRSLTYRVPEGLQGWYTGSDIFYGDLAEALCVLSDPESPESESETGNGLMDRPKTLREIGATDSDYDTDAVTDAVRAYLVAAAIRLKRVPDRLGPNSARRRAFVDEAEAKRLLSPPLSMLIHPSSTMADHFSVASALRQWWLGTDTKDNDDAADGVLADLEVNEDRWAGWVVSYEDSSHQVHGRYEQAPRGASRVVPNWTEIRTTIVEELLPATRISVINSDPAADDRPQFAPWKDDAGWRAPRDQSTIFVSGNVMSRGLTLEGLLTTVFTRSSHAPLADTQMQMQRWFGYRGEYIDLCRVFLPREQYSLFAQYSDADHALREQVLAAMESDASALPDFTVLQGAAYRATGKIAGVRGRSLTPGRRPFIRHLNPAGADDTNLRTVADVFRGAMDDGDFVPDRRGLLNSSLMSLREAADLLDQLRYQEHGGTVREARRWQSLEQQADIGERDPSSPLYRGPSEETGSVDLGGSSPYAIAAYLRFWAACLDRNLRGLVTDEDPPQRWNLLNLDVKRNTQPQFRVGLRFGGGDPLSNGALAELGEDASLAVRPMERASEGNLLSATWGSRGAIGAGYTSDDLFDFQVLGETPDLHPDGTRKQGSPGLILFHVIDRRDSIGAIAVGLSIPSGGPDHIEAVTAVQR